eukprot:9437681-Pyramimonas_sp.AAC.1
MRIGIWRAYDQLGYHQLGCGCGGAGMTYLSCESDHPGCVSGYVVAQVRRGCNCLGLGCGRAGWGPATAAYDAVGCGWDTGRAVRTGSSWETYKA